MEHSDANAVLSANLWALDPDQIVGTHPMITGAATVFTVRDMTKSVEHYRNALGFVVTFQYGNPIFYTCLCRDEAFAGIATAASGAAAT
jgi:hypothetical protein